VLFVCAFLPAVEACDETIYPIQEPAVLQPYAYGLVLAIAALVRTARGLRALRLALGALVVVGGVACAVVGELRESAMLGALVTVAAIIALVPLVIPGNDERRIAAASGVMGLLGIVWFGLLATEPGALIGIYASIAGSLGLVVGALVWLAETGPRPGPPLSLGAGIRDARGHRRAPPS